MPTLKFEWLKSLTLGSSFRALADAAHNFDIVFIQQEIYFEFKYFIAYKTLWSSRSQYLNQSSLLNEVIWRSCLCAKN